MRWIWTGSGYLNLDHVIRLDQAEGQFREFQNFIATMVDGSTEKVGFDRGLELASLLEPIVPATPGQEAITVSTEEWGENDAPIRPTAGGVATTRYPIIGWRLPAMQNTLFKSPRPILPIQVPVNCTVMVLLADGRLISEESEYDSIEDMEEVMLQRAQDAWDRTHLTPTDGNDRMGRMI